MEQAALWGIGSMGALLLLLTGFGLGRSLRSSGLTNSLLVTAILGLVGGTVLTGYAAMHGPDLPLVIGAVGAALLAVQQTH